MSKSERPERSLYVLPPARMSEYEQVKLLLAYAQASATLALSMPERSNERDRCQTEARQLLVKAKRISNIFESLR